MSGTCKTCAHWMRMPRPTDPYEYINRIVFPQDPDADDDELHPMEMPFDVFRCRHPSMTFCERPVERNGFGVADGSNHHAALYTAEDFGCVRWESLK